MTNLPGRPSSWRASRSRRRSLTRTSSSGSSSRTTSRCRPSRLPAVETAAARARRAADLRQPSRRRRRQPCAPTTSSTASRDSDRSGKGPGHLFENRWCLKREKMPTTPVTSTTTRSPSPSTGKSSRSLSWHAGASYEKEVGLSRRFSNRAWSRPWRRSAASRSTAAASPPPRRSACEPQRARSSRSGSTARC